MNADSPISTFHMCPTETPSHADARGIDKRAPSRKARSCKPTCERSLFIQVKLKGDFGELELDIRNLTVVMRHFGPLWAALCSLELMEQGSCIRNIYLTEFAKPPIRDTRTAVRQVYDMVTRNLVIDSGACSRKFPHELNADATVVKTATPATHVLLIVIRQRRHI